LGYSLNKKIRLSGREKKWLFGNVQLVVQKKKADANPDIVVAVQKTLLKRKTELFLLFFNLF
jgi:hypothetical protein